MLGSARAESLKGLLTAFAVVSFSLACLLSSDYAPAHGAPMASPTDAKSVGAISVDAKSSAAKLDGWLFMQTKLESGNQEVSLTENAVKIRNLTHGFTAICKAPDWTVSFFRDDTPKVWQSELGGFGNNMLFVPMSGPRLKEKKVLQVGHSKEQGLECTIFKSDDSTVVCPDKVKLAPQISEFVCRYYDVPKMKTFPLSWFIAKKETARVEPTAMPWLDKKSWSSYRDVGMFRLKTSSWVKKKFSATDFALPENYKRTANIHDITYSKKSRGDMTELLEDLGFSQSEKELTKVRQSGKK